MPPAPASRRSLLLAPAFLLAAVAVFTAIGGSLAMTLAVAAASSALVLLSGSGR